MSAHFKTINYFAGSLKEKLRNLLECVTMTTLCVSQEESNISINGDVMNWLNSNSKFEKKKKTRTFQMPSVPYKHSTSSNQHTVDTLQLFNFSSTGQMPEPQHVLQEFCHYSKSLKWSSIKCNTSTKSYVNS